MVYLPTLHLPWKSTKADSFRGCSVVPLEDKVCKWKSKLDLTRGHYGDGACSISEFFGWNIQSYQSLSTLNVRRARTPTTNSENMKKSCHHYIKMAISLFRWWVQPLWKILVEYNMSISPSKGWIYKMLETTTQLMISPTPPKRLPFGQIQRSHQPQSRSLFWGVLTIQGEISWGDHHPMTHPWNWYVCLN